MSGRAATRRVTDRRSADRVSDEVTDTLGLRPGGFREALRTAIRETAYNVADWAGSGETGSPADAESRIARSRNSAGPFGATRPPRASRPLLSHPGAGCVRVLLTGRRSAVGRG